MLELFFYNFKYVMKKYLRLDIKIRRMIVCLIISNILIYSTVLATSIDITNAITDISSVAHDCTLYAVDKHDTSKHWKECSICSNEYIKAGRPNSSDWTNQYLEIKTNTDNQRVLALKNTMATHNYTNVYWTMGNSCSQSNKQIHDCDCGYSYTSTTGRNAHTGRYYNDTNYYSYVYNCTTCNYNSTAITDFAPQAHGCIKSDGTTINCSNLGTCVKCGYTYTVKKHRVHVGSNKCIMCGKAFGTITYEGLGNSTLATDGKLKIKFLVTPTSAETYSSSSSHLPESSELSLSTATQTNADGSFRVIYTLSQKVKSQVEYRIDPHIHYNREANEIVHYASSAYFRFDYTAPTVSITQTDSAVQ